MYQTLFIFFTYAILGWCLEVAFHALVTGKFINRGFLNGPWCPVYGFGASAVLACLLPLRGSVPLLFLGSLLVTSALEWLTGFVLEQLFHQRWWDYSDEPFNLNGYICLRFSLAWGLACLLVVDFIHPTVLWLIARLPHALGVVLLGVLLAAILLDLTATVRTIAKLNRRLRQIDEAAAQLHAISDEIGGNIADRVLEAAERGQNLRDDLQASLIEWKGELADQREEFLERTEVLRQKLEQALSEKNAGEARLMAAFPRMRSLQHGSALERLRRWEQNRKKEP
jgi:uncharacterized membrane protein